MAIYRLTGDGGVSVDGLITFLNAHKEGTFLANAEIVKETTHPIPDTPNSYYTYGDTMRITLGDASFRMAYVSSTSEQDKDGNIAMLNNNDFSAEYDHMWTQLKSYGSKIGMGNVMLCSNGIIFEQAVKDGQASSVTNVARLALVSDGNGGLCMLNSAISKITSGGGYVPPYAERLWVASRADVFEKYVVSLKPAQNYIATVISNVCLFGTDTIGELENVFLATVSQQNVEAERAEAVTLDGKNYITNGRIYIMDE